MRFALPDLRLCLTGAGYFVTASLAVALTRYGGGVAFLWLASSLLIAELMARPRRHWWPLVAICAVASTMATGLFGFGWAAAVPFAVINMTEGVVAALVFRHFGHSLRPLGSLSWLMHFVVSVGLAGPLVAAAMAACVVSTMGLSPVTAFVNFSAGHALGNITFTPVMLLFARRGLAKTLKDARRRDAAETVGLLVLVIGVTVVVFLQRSLPLLFLPILPLILVTFRVGRGGAAIGIVLLALMGGGATMAGLGPIQMIDVGRGLQLQFFQFYLATTVLTILPVAADLQNRARLHRDMRMSEERYRLMAEHSSDILLHLDVDGRIRYVSPSILQIGGHIPRSLIGRNTRILIAPEHFERVREAHADTLRLPGETQAYDFLAITATGERRWFEAHARAILDDDGEIEGVISIVRDISARKETELRLAADAMTDPLTGLPNRRAFRAAVDLKEMTSGIGPDDCMAVLDLDHFKVVNDSFGHDVGDDVLRSLSALAKSMIRDGDFLARIGGEEFAIFFPDTSVAQAKGICDRLGAAMARSDLNAGSISIRVTVSGGVAAMGEGGLDEAFRQADHALYSAKRNGRDQFALAA